MREFTLDAYQALLEAALHSHGHTTTIEEYIKNPAQGALLLRHDVDRKPLNALAMAELEYKLGQQGTYYFRYKPCSWNEEIANKIQAMNHEVGYHYECLSDRKNNLQHAHELFKFNLNKMNSALTRAPIKTISMHGRPLSSIDNRDMWADKKSKTSIFSECGIIGEAYLDIDYTNIAYITDTGRNWSSGKSNKRDKVDSLIDTDYKNFEELLNSLKQNNKSLPLTRVLQIHPERWAGNRLDWSVQLLKDCAINTIKKII